MKKVFSTIGAALICMTASTTAMADVKVGEPMPALKYAELYNNEYDVTLTELQGYVVVVEFWATWCGPCRRSIPHLNEMQEKLGKEGVVFIGMSDEEPDTVKKFMKNIRMDYLVTAGSESARDFGVKGIPAAFIIDTEGTVQWIGHPLDNAFPAKLSKVLRDTPPTRRLGGGPEHNARLLDDIEASLAKGQAKHALDGLARIDVESLPMGDGHASRHQAVVAALTPIAEAEFEVAMADLKAKKYNDALARFKMISKEYRALPIAKKAETQLATLEKSDEVQRAQRSAQVERLAGNSLARAKKLAASGKDVAAYRKLQVVVDRYPKTDAAKEAETLLAEMEADAEFMAKIGAEG